MRLVNFIFDSEIEIGVAGHPRFLDLHNIYSWQGIVYLPEKQQVTLTWTRPDGDRIQPDLPSLIVLEFRGVSRLAASPHDPEMPYSEDTCLDEVTVSPPEPPSDFKGEDKLFRNDSGHITFMFRSGFSLKIWADEVELWHDRMPNSSRE
ncbi:MAG TPA: hypothetical protein VGO57_11005 [Verrucomicrobiae bacterium]|jgi:hypothetical protein